jgi:hypothetical protein
VWMKDVDTDTMVPVVIIFCLFVIHVLSEFQDTVSVNVTNLRMVDKNEKLVSFCCLLLIDKVRVKDKTYI